MRTHSTLSLLLLAAVSLTFACAAPAPARVVDLPPAGAADPSAPAALLEPRLLTLDAPAVVRRGDYAVIRLTFAPAPEDIPGLALPLADAFASHTVIAEARLELPGLTVRPPGLVSQPLAAGQGVTFTWYVQPQEAGRVSGTAWFFLRFAPREESAETAGQADGPESGLPVAALPLRFEVVSLAGLTGSAARLLGGIGAFLGLLLALSFLLRKERGKIPSIMTKIM